MEFRDPYFLWLICLSKLEAGYLGYKLKLTYLPDLINPDTPQPVHRMWEAVHTLKYRLIPIDSTEGAGTLKTVPVFFFFPFPSNYA
jgi:hypothetical protein